MEEERSSDASNLVTTNTSTLIPDNDNNNNNNNQNNSNGNEGEGQEEQGEVVYKTKAIHFLGRSTPIILQNDNGPCPLLAICNVLLLRNSLSLSVDTPEVSQQKLLSLVAEKLIDSNSNIENKDDDYVINQQQNIADAIDLLPRLATGIDVNVQFRKVNDFEFTRECAVFDLLDIGLYHGWIVDPQDTETAATIGSKSYNTLVGELVAFEAGKSAGEEMKTPEDDSVDFAAATTATLGVPSPSLSRGRSFDDCPVSVPVDQGSRKGDREEDEELMRALNLSKIETSSSVNANSPHILAGSGQFGSSGSGNHLDSSVAQVGVELDEPQQSAFDVPQQCKTSILVKDDKLNSDVSPMYNVVVSSNNNVAISMDYSVSEAPGEFATSNSPIETARTDLLMPAQTASSQSAYLEDSNGCYGLNGSSAAPGEQPSISESFSEDLAMSQIPERPGDDTLSGKSAVSPQPAHCADFHLPAGRKGLLDIPEVGSSSLDDGEPIYEGEECILDSGAPKYENREPVYEGEMVLSRQADNTAEKSEHIINPHQCRLIRNFLENSASQLTIYGLFCLQEDLKERELCVFFRNNHFNTMFKFNGNLYLLATDQGYINQPDLVWEKLNEVNGDTLYMTSNFTEFKIENQTSESWNEESAMTSTADFLAKFEATAPANSSFNSDLQLAIALQQQEFGQQSQQQRQRAQQQSSQQPAVSGRPRLVTGPQVSRSSYAPQRNESKKDKCSVM